MAEFTLMLRKNDSSKASNTPAARAGAYGDRGFIYEYYGKDGHDEVGCYNKQRAFKRCGYCGRNGHDENDEYWAKERDEQRRREGGRWQQPQEDVVDAGEQARP